jgi:alpha-beta hydrolase superfamily lysophospholipase
MPRLPRFLTIAAFAFCAVLLGGAPALAKEKFKVTELSVRAGKATLHGEHYSNPGGKPWVLWHGVTETSSVWRDWARALAREGFDVYAFNFRGHGLGRHHSSVRNPRKGDYEFEKLVA